MRGRLWRASHKGTSSFRTDYVLFIEPMRSAVERAKICFLKSGCPKKEKWMSHKHNLNPVRAGIASNLEEADFTSIQDRIRHIQQNIPEGKPALMNFREAEKDEQTEAVLPFAFKDYLELVDWTGRMQRPDKKGFIQITEPRLLQSLTLTTLQWRQLVYEVQKEATTKLSGMNKLAVIERRKPYQAAA